MDFSIMNSISPGNLLPLNKKETPRVLLIHFISWWNGAFLQSLKKNSLITGTMFSPGSESFLSKLDKWLICFMPTAPRNKDCTPNKRIGFSPICWSTLAFYKILTLSWNFIPIDFMTVDILLCSSSTRAKDFFISQKSM